MKHYLSFHLFLLLTAASFSSHAIDIKHGEQSAKRCMGCHGLGGASKNPTVPILSGQNAKYLNNQLHAFKSGKRANSMMNSLAARLDKHAIENISAYFASQPHVSAGGNEKLAVMGKSKVSQCFGCHGNKAQGNANIPKLAGQQPKYLEKQLHAFKSGKRKSGPMESVAKHLSDQDIKEITAYLGTL